MLRELRVWTGWISVVVVAGAAGGGCGGGEFGVSVSRPAGQRPDVTESVARRGALRLPEGEPFNLVAFTSGQKGAAAGASTAAKEGTARATAESQDGGSAWGEFQLGYCFDNAGSVPLGAVVRVKVDCARTLHASGDDPGTQAKADFKFFIKDSNGAVLHTEPLTLGAVPRGPSEWSGVQESVFEVRFEPNVGYYLVAAARVEAASADGQKATARLDVRRAELTVEWREVPAARVEAGQERIASGAQ